MKPVIVESHGQAFYAMHTRAIHSTGKRLQVVFATNKPPFVDDRVFDWPWKVQIATDSEGCAELDPLF